MKYNKTYLARRLVLSLIIGGMFVSSANALPQGGAVVGGSSSGTIGGSGNIMNITGKGNNNVAIRWEQFNIANGETVNFKNMASVLNYVTGNTKSEIYGALNGQGVNVFLFNPNGILFGKGAAVNVGSLHASTGKMTDENINGFNGTPTVDLSNVTADVLNLGVIRADKVTIEGANISLGNAADIQKQNGDAITAADKANYVLKADGVVNVGYETTGTKTITIVENGTNKDHTIRDYTAGAAATGSTLFTGSKLTSSEDNTINDCMLISNIYELQSINNKLDGNYMLTNKIEADVTSSWNNGKGFVPLGDGTEKGADGGRGGQFFKGSFDGMNYTVEKLTINRGEDYNIALFGGIANTSIIRNVGVVNGSITGKRHVAGVVGWNAGGIINNVWNEKTAITANEHNTGGVVAINKGGTVSNAYNTGTVTGKGDRVGGVVGIADTGTKLDNLYNYGTVTGSNGSVGGVVATATGSTLRNLYNTGTVTANGTNVGGISGMASGSTLSYAVNSGAVTNRAQRGAAETGGIVGYSSGNISISNVSNSGTITGAGSVTKVGGIVGDNDGYGKISAAANTGTVQAADGVTVTNLGGIVGNNRSSQCTIENVYNTGIVQGNASAGKGSIAGDNVGAIKNSTSATTDAQGNPINGGLNTIGSGSGSVSNVENKSYTEVNERVETLQETIANDSGWIRVKRADPISETEYQLLRDVIYQSARHYLQQEGSEQPVITIVEDTTDVLQQEEEAVQTEE